MHAQVSPDFCEGKKKAVYKKFNERWVQDWEVHQRRKAAPKLYIPSMHSKN